MKWPADEGDRRWCIGPCERLPPRDEAHFALNLSGRRADGTKYPIMRRTCRACWRYGKRQRGKTQRVKLQRRAQSKRDYLKRREAICRYQRRYWHEVRRHRAA